MLAFHLAIHALRQLWGNRGATLRLSLLPGLLWLAFGAGPMLLVGAPHLRVEGNGVVALIAAGLLAVMLYLLIAVAWHRHILLDEPAHLHGHGRGRQVLAYLGRVVLILLVMVPALIAAVLLMRTMMTVAIQSGGSPGWIAAIAFVVGVALTALVLRLLTVLPGAALRHPRPWGAAWAATKGRTPTFLLLSIIVTSAQTLLPNVIGLVATTSIMLALLLHVLLTWLGALFTLSLLTTLWGHFVEGRALR